MTWPLRFKRLGGKWVVQNVGPVPRLNVEVVSDATDSHKVWVQMLELAKEDCENGLEAFLEGRAATAVSKVGFKAP